MEALVETEGVRAGFAGDILVFHHSQLITPATIEIIQSVEKRAFGNKSMRPAQLVVIDPGVPPPDAEVRSRLISFARRNDLSAFALVIRGRGFAPAAMRAALAGMKLLARTPYPIGVFATIAEATRWIADKTGASNDACVASTREIEAFTASSR